MLLGKLCYMKTKINYRNQAWNNPLQSAGSKTSFYHISIILQTFTKVLSYFSKLKMQKLTITSRAMIYSVFV